MTALAHSQPHALMRATIEHHSKSFALASRLLPAEARLDAQVLYAYCRHADDAVDEAPVAAQPARLRRLRRDLDAVYAAVESGTVAPREPLLSALTDVVVRRRIPRVYFDELLRGMEMDVRGVDYADQAQLLRYCYRVASTVGLMMCHVMGVRRPEAIVHAAHLGIAMQLTNICRDVHEDWARGRLYLPDDLLAQHGAGDLRAALGGPFPDEAAPAVARTIASLLDRADVYYASGDRGIPMLSVGCALGVRVARLVYSGIGEVLRARGCDPRSGRAFVSRAGKLWRVVRAAVRTLWALPAAPFVPRPVTPSHQVRDMETLPWLA